MRKKILCAALVIMVLAAALSVSAYADNWSRLSGTIKEMNVDAGLDAAAAGAAADSVLGSTADPEKTQSVVYKLEGNMYYRIVRGDGIEGWLADATGYTLAAVSGELDDGEWYVIGTYKKALVLKSGTASVVPALEGSDVSLEGATVISGEEPCTYAWQVLVPEGNWADAGCAESALTLTDVTLEMDGYSYRCKVNDNDGGEKYTDTVTLDVLADNALGWSEISLDTVSITPDEGVTDTAAAAQANSVLGNKNDAGKKQVVFYTAGDEYKAIVREKDECGWRSVTYVNYDSIIASLVDGDVYVVGAAENAPFTIRSPKKDSTKKIDYMTGTGTVSLSVTGGRAPYHYELEGKYYGGVWEEMKSSDSSSLSYSINISKMDFPDNNVQFRIIATDSNGVTLISPVTTVQVTMPYTVTGNYFKPYSSTENCVLTICKGNNDLKYKENVLSVSFAGKDITSELTAGKNGSIKDGPITVTLSKAYLNTLKLGTYKLVVTMGDASNPVVINETVTVSNVPKTSDNTNIVLLSVLLVMCTAAAVVAGRKRRAD